VEVGAWHAEVASCVWQELWSLLEFMMPDIFDTSGVDLDQYLGTRNSTNGVLAQDKELITHIKAILGPFVLRRVKSDVMRQLVAKTHEVLFSAVPCRVGDKFLQCVCCSGG